jgi:hypothetical protein
LQGGGFSDRGRKRKDRGQRYEGEVDGMGWEDGKGMQVLGGEGRRGRESLRRVLVVLCSVGGLVSLRKCRQYISS